MLVTADSSNELVRDLVEALVVRAFTPFNPATINNGVAAIVAEVRAKLGDDAARTVKIPIH